MSRTVFIFTLLAGILSANAAMAAKAMPIWASKKRAHAAFRSGFAAAGSVMDTTKALQDLDLTDVPEWPDYATLEKAFYLVRDERKFKDTEVPNFLRRITWLYTEDGCFQRAAHVALKLEENNFPPVKHFYVFTNIKAEFGWWYHVAAAARVGNTVYIFDPALLPDKPPKLAEWLATFTDSSPQMPVNVCEVGAWEPNTECSANTLSKNDVKNGLKLSEWRESFQIMERQHLGFDANSLLGSTPPWVSAH